MVKKYIQTYLDTEGEQNLKIAKRVYKEDNPADNRPVYDYFIINRALIYYINRGRLE